MSESPDSQRQHQEALREELEAARRRRDSYQALIKDLPEIFEGKFRERVRPLQQRNDQLRLEGLALREQLRRILPQAPGADSGQAAKAAPAMTPAAPVAPPPREPKSGPSRRAPWLWGGVITLGFAATIPLWLRPMPAPIRGEAGPDQASRLDDRRSVTPTGFLRLRSQEPSWLEVQASDGRSLHYGLVQGERLFPLGQGLRLRAGRPDLIRISLPGGGERVLGNVDDLDWQTIPAPRPAR